MNFKPELASLVMLGHKTVTRRALSLNPGSPWHYTLAPYMVGRTFAVCPGRGKPQIGRVLVTSVRLTTLGRLTLAEAKAEGFASVEAFEAAWRSINREYNPAAFVWRVEFERAEAVKR